MIFEAMGLSEWRADPILSSDATRKANWPSVIARIEAWTGSRPTADCEQAFAATGLPVTGYKTVAEALADPQVAHRGSLAEVTLGATVQRVPNLPFKLSDARVEARPETPALGEHTERVLSERLHLDSATLRAASGGTAGTDSR
jgi:formyl-CoA transferase